MFETKIKEKKNEKSVVRKKNLDLKLASDDGEVAGGSEVTDGSVVLW